MRIGIVAAMRHEMEDIENAMQDVESVRILGSEYFKGTLGENEVVLTQSGVGKVNAAIATTILIREFECSFIINTGIAGGTKPLKHRDVVVAESLAYHDFDASAFGYKYGQVPGMPAEYLIGLDSIVLVKSVLNKLGIEYKTAKVYSGDQFVTNLSAFNKLDNYDGIATEMEGAGVAQTCVRAGIDFVVLRYISDIVGEENQQESYMEFEEDMAHNSAIICIKLVSNIG